MSVKTISESTPVKLGFAVTAVCLILSCAMYQSSQLHQIQRGMDAIQFRLDRQEEALADRWTTADMKIWELEMRLKNPTLTVPSAWDITHQRRKDEK